MAVGVEERDEGGQYAVADSAQRQAHAMRGHAAQYMAEGKMFASRHMNRALAIGQCQANGADEHRDHADGAQAPLRVFP